MDDKTKGLLIAGVVGLALAYYLNTSSASAEPLASGPGILPPPTPPGGGGSPPGGGGSVGGSTGGGSLPSSGGGVVNKAAGDRAATPKEKQQALNWLQGLIQKNCNKSIYTPFSESDLATGSFGPKSRAALAVAEQIMRAAEASLPKAGNRNLFSSGTAGDAALQALVDANTLGGATYTPNAAELQALVKAAGGAAGSIGAGTPAPTGDSSTLLVTACPKGRAEVIQNVCRFFADALDYNMTVGSSRGIRVPVDGRLTAETLIAYRRVLMMLRWISLPANMTTTSHQSAAFFPPANLIARIGNKNNYTLVHRAYDGAAVGRLDPQMLDFFNGVFVNKKPKYARDVITGMNTGIDSNTTLADALEKAYDSFDVYGWNSKVANGYVPMLALTEDTAAEEYPGKRITYA